MSDFIASLDSPLGIPKPNTLALVSFDLPIAKGDKIHCLDVLHSLTKHTLGFVDDGSEDFSKVSTTRRGTPLIHLLWLGTTVWMDPSPFKVRPTPLRTNVRTICPGTVEMETVEEGREVENRKKAEQMRWLVGVWNR